MTHREHTVNPATGRCVLCGANEFRRQFGCRSSTDDEPNTLATQPIELAWLIENRDSETVYLTGDPSGYFPNWTADSLEAIRFSRRIDAERVAVIFDDLDIHICEHQWG